MKTGIKVGDVMTKKFVSVTPDMSIVYCAKLMSKKSVGSLIVKDDQKLKGIVTEGDVMKSVANGLNLDKTKFTIYYSFLNRKNDYETPYLF